MNWFKMPVIGLLVVVILHGELASADKTDGTPLEKLKGKWVLRSLAFSDYELKGTQQKPMTVVISDQRLVIRPSFNITESLGFRSNSEGSFVGRWTTVELTQRDREFSLRLDPTDTPMQIDVEETIGNKLVVRKGIYRHVDDELEICLGVKSGFRPEKFAPGLFSLLLRLERPAPESKAKD